jgi:hypothetical protein
MTNKNYKIVFNTEYKDFNLDMLNDYWDFSDFDNLKFNHTIKSLLDRYNLRTPDKLERIVKNSGYIIIYELMDCERCIKEIKILKRRDIDFKKDNRIIRELKCYPCKKNKAEDSIKLHLKNFIELISLKENVEFSSPNSELTYLENIFLYVLVTKSTIIKESISLNEWNLFNEIEADGFSDIINRLIKKGYIFITNQYDNIIKKQHELHMLKLEFECYIEDKIKKEVTKYLSLNFRAEIKIIIPQKINNLEQWVEELYKNILNYELNIDDYKEIKNYLDTKRLVEVYCLLDEICSRKKIPIKKNNALEFNLRRMVSKFNLNEIYSLLIYQANKTMSKLYEVENIYNYDNKFVKEPQFNLKISSYLDYLEERNEKPKYSRALPEDWNYSDVELFVSANRSLS